MLKKALRFAVGAAIIFYGFLLIYFSEAVGAGVLTALKSCINVIIPSLYCFMVLSGVIISSGLYRIIGRPFSLPARYIFHLSPDMFSVFLISCAAGYPVGAKMASDLLKSGKISSEECEKMLAYCYMGGPAFFCGTAGAALYSNEKIGLIIFLCIFLSNLLCAFIFGIGKPVPPKAEADFRLKFSLNDLICSVSSGGKSIFAICTMIVFFSSFSAILSSCGAISKAAEILSNFCRISCSDCEAALRSILEISCITGFSKGNAELLPLVTALLSFGGLCVIMQVSAIVGKNVSMKYFYFGRFISIVLSYLCCNMVLYFGKLYEVLSVSSEITVGVRQTSPIPSVFLLIMTILLLSNNWCSKIRRNVL